MPAAREPDKIIYGFSLKCNASYQVQTNSKVGKQVSLVCLYTVYVYCTDLSLNSSYVECSRMAADLHLLYLADRSLLLCQSLHLVSNGITGLLIVGQLDSNL